MCLLSRSPERKLKARWLSCCLCIPFDLFCLSCQELIRHASRLIPLFLLLLSVSLLSSAVTLIHLHFSLSKERTITDPYAAVKVILFALLSRFNVIIPVSEPFGHCLPL